MDSKIVVERLNDRAYEIIKEKILTKEFPAGTRLVDTQLAAEFGISRTPIRDAIRKLTEEGLVVAGAAKGYFVFGATERDIEEIFELRLMMDRMVVEKLITKVAPADPDGYRNRLDQIRLATFEGPSDSFADRDEHFHDMLVDMADNSRLSKLYNENRSQTRMFRHLTATKENRTQIVTRMHSEILDALYQEDLIRALDAVTDHIEWSIRCTLEDLHL